MKTLTLWQVSLSKRAMLLGDVLAIGLAFCLATLLNIGWDGQSFSLASKWFSTQDPSRYLAWAGLSFLALVVFLFRYQHYINRRPFWDELSDVLSTVATLALLDMSLVAITRWNASRLWWLFAWCSLGLMIMLMRHLMRWALSHYGLWARPTILLGQGQNALDAIEALISEPRLGYQLIGRVEIESEGPASAPVSFEQLPQALMKLPLLEKQDNQALAHQPGVQWVLALDHGQSSSREHWLRQLSQWGAQEICVIPDMRGIPLYGTHMSYFFSHEVTVLRIRNNLKRWPTRLTKRLFDTVVATLLLLLFSPLFIYLYVQIKKDGGPAFFKQQRIGRRGQVFECLKFRTMVVDAQAQLQALLLQDPHLRAEWEQDHKIKNDPRITPLGAFLRRTSLDEIPQLLNVLKGEMSLVGPRPIVQAELEKYGDDVGYFLMVRPGMTGLWQVSGRSDMSYDKRVYLDTWYVKNWSLWYDLVILFKTVNVVIARSGAY
jgi:Undecaprenyl-phosphate galactose phosphotransferase WbaP